MGKDSKKACEMTRCELASYIDYSVLKPEFSMEEIKKLAEDAVRLGCASVCINPAYIELCEPIVKDSNTSVCPVCDFPFGTASTESRIQQLRIAAKSCCVKEIDLVANFGLIIGGNYSAVKVDLAECTKACHDAGKEIKVIFETDALNERQIRKLCDICVEIGTDFVKSSTGFLTGFELKGAAPEVIQIMIDQVAGRCKVKGSGNIRTREHFLRLIDMGIDRMGVGYKSVPVVLGL